jgi:hypothetical protein
MLVVIPKPQKRFSTKGWNKYRAHISKQGVPSSSCYSDITRLHCVRGWSHQHKQPHPTQHAHQHFVTQHAAEHTSSDGLLKSTMALQPSHQNANMVRLAPDSCHARARSRIRVALDTHDYLHQQCARIFITVCTNDSHWLHLTTSQSAHGDVFILAFITDPCKARQANQWWHFIIALATKNRVEKLIYGSTQWLPWQDLSMHSDHKRYVL